MKPNYPYHSVRYVSLFLISFVAVLLASCSNAPVQDKASTDLFAPDLSNALNTDGVWSYEDGILSASEDKCLWTTKTYSNFKLDLEFKTAEGTNSGVIIYCADRENWIPNSVEIQIADDHSEQWSNADPSWQCAAFFGHKAPDLQGVVKAPGEWNKMQIIAQASKIKVELNGQRVNAIDLSDYTSAEVAPDGTQIPSWLSTPWAELAPEGYIGFQGKHAGAPIYLRNIRITPLPHSDK